MSSINLQKDEIGIKIVYYGPGLGGKTSSIQAIHKALRPDNKGQLVSLATGVDRTLYFDFLPVKLPKVGGFTIRLSLYTVPGQVHYNATRKLVLQGADGVVFVADSQVPRHEANLESIKNLYDNLKGHGMDPASVPLVIQYNKRDLPNVVPVSKMDEDLNPSKLPFFETSATTGQGVFDALKAITKLVLADLKRKGIAGRESPADLTPGSGTELSGTIIDKPVSAKGGMETTGLQQAIASHLESEASDASRASTAPSLDSGMGAGAAEISAPSLSALWARGQMREHLLAIERDIVGTDYMGAVQKASSALGALIEEVGGSTVSLAEALLALGVHGGHYVRYQRVITSGSPSRADALFCIFFLVDIELRLQEAGARSA